MAYLRKSRYARKTRRTPRRYVKTTRKTRYVRKRRPVMTKRRMLNATSTKKRNTMLQVVNTSTGTGAPVTIGPGPYLVNASNGNNISVYCPTAMDLSGFTGNPNTISQQASRTATTCYIRGFSEKIRIQTSSGTPWFWRRICFRARGNAFHLFSAQDTPSQTNSGVTSY